MKKMRLIMVTIVCLIATLVVSSFAWFSIGNNGIFSHPVSTMNKLVIDFTISGNNGEAMMPAKLKKGVINDPSGTIVGENELVPKDRRVLPKYDENTWKYELNEEKNAFIPQSEYLETPATIVYSQFEIEVLDNEHASGTKDVTLTFQVKYYNIEQLNDETVTINDLSYLKQIGALAFNFFVVENDGGLSSEELITISTHKGEITESRTIEDFIVSRNTDQDETNNILLHSKEGSSSNKVTSCESVGAYRHEVEPLKDDEGKYTYEYSVTFEEFNINQKYYILLESYYSVPDALVEGNLPLTGRFVLDLHYNYK